MQKVGCAVEEKHKLLAMRAVESSYVRAGPVCFSGRCFSVLGVFVFLLRLPGYNRRTPGFSVKGVKRYQVNQN